MEMRKSRRIAFEHAATLDLETVALDGRTENISLHGAMLHLPDLSSAAGAAVKPGSVGELSFVLPGYPGRVALKVVVRWRSAVLVDSVGVEFRDALDDDARKLLVLIGCDDLAST